MEKVYIVSAVRTPIGKFGGCFSDLSACQLGSIVIKEALKRAAIQSDQVSEVLMGCVLQAGLGQNVARQAAIEAGIPVSVPATTINNVCGSSLKAIDMGATIIKSGQADIIVAGGTESMSQAPFLLKKARFGYRMGNGTIIDSLINDSLWDVFGDCHMGVTAENIAKEFDISREEQDCFAALSQQKCEAARQAQLFNEEIVPVTVQQKKALVEISCDEFPRDGVTKESLSALKPAFEKNGTVTAGNSSGINDGAACVVLISERKMKELNIKPLAEYIVGVSVGVNPSIMGVGAGFAAKKVLEISGYKMDDISLIEANEAFAAQSIASARIAGWDKCMEKVNVNGGAIALGHPVGASGCRILVSLLYELKRKGGGIGLATLCVGGGMGVSAIVEVKQW